MRRHAVSGLLLLAFLIIYLPDIGHGFIKDDFGWIGNSRVSSGREGLHLFSRSVGFYRPLVSLSFALNYQFSHVDPFGYGITNLIVFLIDALLLFRLARLLSLPGTAALLTVATWSFNFHGVNMALLWISGRTALLMCMFAIGAAMAVLSGKGRMAGVLSLFAMLCKEEAVLLPVLFVTFDWLQRSNRSPASAWKSVRDAWPTWTALVIYLALRAQSGAFGPQNAPSYYQFSFGLSLLARNVVEYLDRGATVPCAVVAAMLLFLGTIHLAFRPDEKRGLYFGAVWFVSFYALTVFLPVRSDLYALTPSVGTALAAGTIGAAVARLSQKRFERCCVALTIVACVLIPIYRQRNERWVASADVSSNVIRSLRVATASYTAGDVILVDDPSVRFGLDSSFGTLFGDAVHLMLGPEWTGELLPSLNAHISNKPSEARVQMVFMLRNGTLAPARRDEF